MTFAFSFPDVIRVCNMVHFLIGTNFRGTCTVFVDGNDPMLNTLTECNAVRRAGTLLPVITQRLKTGVAADDDGVFCLFRAEQFAHLCRDIKVKPVLSLLEKRAGLEAAAGFADVFPVTVLNMRRTGTVKEDHMV